MRWGWLDGEVRLLDTSLGGTSRDGVSWDNWVMNKGRHVTGDNELLIDL